MSQPLELHANTITATIQTGRRGVDVNVNGALTFAPGIAFDDSTLVLALLDSDGAVLALERNNLRFEEANGQLLRFAESFRLPEALAQRVSAIEGWCSGTIVEIKEIGSLKVEEALPAPQPGTSSFYTLNGATLRRPPPDEGGEVRMTVYGRCALDASSAYDTRAEVRVSVTDAQGAVLYFDESSFETLRGQGGPVSFDLRFRPQMDQLITADALELSIQTKRFVSSERVTIPAAEFTVVQD